ncbi:MAG: GIY-YIG nuclease family protein [Firmicutes bacterium]|nr:GIY-YIG nuclease family protein [Bacillota bacterium]
MDKAQEFRGDQGVYLLWLDLPQSCSITIGKLGEFTFTPGIYAYCGSAQRNLQARINRHRSLEKTLHWHIDYFRARARYLGEVLFLDLPKQGECWLVEELLRIPAAYYPVAGFGSSDCSCGAHLLKVPLAYALGP